MKTIPLWSKGVAMPRIPMLKRDLEVDVVVVGGGLTGISTALLLQEAGAKVALLERETFAGADTGHTTAHLTYVTDLRVSDLVKTFGEEPARGVMEAGNAALHQIYELAESRGIECDFKWVPAYLHSSVWQQTSKEEERLRKDAELARQLGFPAEFMENVPFLEQPGVRFPDQAKFHPRKYLAGLLQDFVAKGGFAFEGAGVDAIEEKPLRVKAGGFAVSGRYVVIATHVPLQGFTGAVKAMLFQTKLAPYTTYAIGAKIPPGHIPEALYWDTEDPYHFLRIEKGTGSDYAIFGGEDHKTGQKGSPSEAFEKLERKLLRLESKAKVNSRWSGQVIETNDGLPFIGETAEKQYVATGFAGNGMTFGTTAAMMIRDAIQGTSNPWRKLFDVRRKKLFGGTWTYLTENKDYPYYYLRDRLLRPEGNSLRGVGRGEGKIVEVKGERVAAYRDGNGKMHVKSAVCPHMGCIVRWNDAEKSWDCPCHGSRFHGEGKVMAGPAESDLAEPKKQ